MKKIVLTSSLVILAVVLLGGTLFLDRANAQDIQPGPPMGGYGMMGGYNGFGQSRYDMMNMMHGFGGLVNAKPLTIEQAATAVNNYLESYGDDNLVLGEIMIFDNHAYAQVLNSKTGDGAFEVLVDPATGNVFPEPGPNMMWNTEYGMMSGQFGGMMGGYGMMNGQFGNRMGSSSMMNGQFGNRMGSFGFDPDAKQNVTEEDAVRLAQEYLNTALPGTTADDHADPFPGYYTIHVERDGGVIGMLSVNQYTGQVFLHHWHGDFIEMANEGH